jgi:hypothetical protein
MILEESCQVLSLRFYFFKIVPGIQIKFGFPTIINSVPKEPLPFTSIADHQRSWHQGSLLLAQDTLKHCFSSFNLYLLGKPMPNRN